MCIRDRSNYRQELDYVQCCMCPRICKNCQLNCSVGPGETALVIALTCSVGTEATQIVLVLELQLHLGYSNLHIRPLRRCYGFATWLRRSFGDCTDHQPDCSAPFSNSLYSL